MLDVALVLASSGCWFAGALLSASSRPPERLATGLGLLGSLLALGASIHLLLGGSASGLTFRVWGLPARLELDALSAAFLLPLHLVGGLGLIYGQRYWPVQTPWGSGRFLRFFYGLLVAAMTLLFIARHGLVFLVAWELMAVSAFFLVGTEHERPEVRRASWVYLACTHTGTLLLTAMVILMAQRMGGLTWIALPVSTSPLFEGGILVLALAGFGFKAGVLPLHFWLPSAHASAPSHVSAILSAVMLKTGIYGLLRVSSLLPGIPRGVGGALLALGALTAVYGVGNALAQRDYKRLLAYSSIENLGIILMGVGLGWTGRATHDPWLMALGFGGALFHIWNHSLFKSLLFYGAGAVLHATGTRDMEALGGLARRMPRTALVIFPAVLAVTALPPFNAFLSEWFLYRGLFSSLARGYPWSAALGLVALALAGGLAAVAFARFFGTLFLGSPRSEVAEHAHDPAFSMLLPMAILAGLCLAVGLGSFLLLPLLDRVVAVAAPGAPALLDRGLRTDLHLLAGVELGLLVLVGAGIAWLRRPEGVVADSAQEDLPTWGCGYATTAARAQYTGSSFADAWAPVQPGLRRRMPHLRGLFPGGASFRQAFREPIGEVFLAPRVARLAERLLRFRRLQPGHLSVYLLYVLLTLLAVFLWMLLRTRLLG
ncbi:proton-conducting transporter transmembrane domain-containing protein [Geothrix fuzhouensis]|uniref:proton-conducting transporter transmembrane domain-containing protein n=1 Tax=Geothrix fuzhouensis TaxID=2966451 RepID=UPI002148A868|nr:proton-conducting transporter membrane subunit [Geothrix fuzhouensis]